MLNVGEWDSLRDGGVVLLNSEREMSMLTEWQPPQVRGIFSGTLSSTDTPQLQQLTGEISGISFKLAEWFWED